MFPTASLTASLLLAVSVAANPIVVRKAPVSLPIARRFNITGAHDIIQKDQARAKNHASVGKAKESGTMSADVARSVGITNQGTYYLACIGVGSPATDCELTLLHLCPTF